MRISMKESSPRIDLSVAEVKELLCYSVDITTMTYEELSEAINLAGKSVQNINLIEVVEKALTNLSYGGSQVRLAEAGGYPCENCPDCYLEEAGSCRNEDRCKAWDIFSNQY